MKNLIIAAATVLFCGSAMAVDGPLWACKLKADLSGEKVGLGIAHSALKGPGVINCRTADGEQVRQLPVNVKIYGWGVGLGYADVEHVSLYALGLGLVTDPETLASKYSLGVSAGADLISKGLDFDVALTGRDKRGFGLEIGLTAADSSGLQVSVVGKYMKVSLAN